jgi:RNA polymerase sigma factor (sigma-70 family)
MVTAQLHGVLRGLRDTPLSEAPDAQLLEWFARAQEEAPFTALVRRHGPMVWSVAQRVLPQLQDVEDVFQATFLLLARKAESIRKAASVASWLHGVAHRLALKVRVQKARRQSREKRAADMRQSEPEGETSLSEVQAALDTALGELPEKYRAALVLCYLEGNTQEEAARRLDCPLATVRTRLARGRKLLRQRLAKSGLTLSTSGLSALLIASAAPAAAPAAQVKAAVQAALPFAAGQPAAALCSKQAAGLVERGLKTMFLTKAKTATLFLLAACLLAGVAVLTQPVTAKDEAIQPPEPPSAKPRPSVPMPPAEDEKETLAYSGRVLGPDGKPVPGAKLYLTVAEGYLKRPAPSPEYATTGPDGRFAFTVPKARFGNQFTVVAATAANHGPGWVQVPADGKRDDLTIQLVKDDGPITGQIVDLEGKPVAGATLTVLQINAAPREDLGPWLEAARGKKGLGSQIEQEHLARFTIALCPKVTTDAEGRFRLTGIGRNRLVRAQLDGPTITSQPLCILTRPGEPIEVIEHEGQPEYGVPRTVTTYFGANFRHAAAPTRPIVGVVRDRDTRKPLAGITIQSYAQIINPGHSRILDHVVETKTDAEGRYRLTGMPKGKSFQIAAVPGLDQPYVPVHLDVPDSRGLDPVTVDVELKRGVWIEGRITDKVTGKPLQASVEYYSLSSNPNLGDYPGFDGTILMDDCITGVKEDGSYRLVGLPGPGLVGVYYQRTSCLRANERDDEFGTREGSLRTAPYHISFTSNFSALAPIDSARGTEKIQRDITIDPGWTFTCTLVGPDGKPLTGAKGFGTGMPWLKEREQKRTAEFTVRSFNPRRPRAVFFQDQELGLVGEAQPPKENGGSVTVRMESGASITGRLVDADGKPRAGIELGVWYRTKEEQGWSRFPPESIKTDRDGRFHLKALLPGYDYRLSDEKGNLPFGGALRLGHTKDLGDVRLKGEEE